MTTFEALSLDAIVLALRVVLARPSARSSREHTWGPSCQTARFCQYRHCLRNIGHFSPDVEITFELSVSINGGLTR
jgi:hypothetical protein